MSKNKQTLELFLYKHNLQDKTLGNLLETLSSKTVELLIKDLSPFKENSDGDGDDNLYIFTDGGCKNNGRKNAIAGYSVFFTDDETSNYYPFNTSGLVINDASNQRAELVAISKCFKCILENNEVFKNKNIIIVSDSIYSINCITKWSANWKLNGWKTAKGEQIKHMELIQEIIQNLEDVKEYCKISFKHIFSHTKEPEQKNTLQYTLWYGNKRVDENISILLEKN